MRFDDNVRDLDKSMEATGLLAWAANDNGDPPPSIPLSIPLFRRGFNTK
jgi:hypothetical protein